VGEFTALVLLAEIGDITRFGTARRLASWAGLTPTVRGSDLTVRHGHPSKQASLSVRWVLGQAAHIAKQHPESSMHTADQELMRERGVQIESWGPFAEGRNNLFTDPTLSQIAEAHGKSVAQVVLRWLIQRDVVVIPKSVRADRMAQNVSRTADRPAIRQPGVREITADWSYARPSRPIVSASDDDPRHGGAQPGTIPR
jgi:hypothetical protein